MQTHSRDFVRQLPGHTGPLTMGPSGWQKVHIDLPLLLLLLALTAGGLIVLYSASGQNTHMLMRQGTFICIAYVVMIVIAQIKVDILKRWAPFLFVIGLALLVAVFFFGTGAKGARRWLAVGGLPRFQPSELMKLVLPLVVAWYLSDRALPPRPRYVFISLMIVALPVVLIAEQPDLGTSILIATSGLFVLLLAGLSWKYVAVAVGLVGAAAYPMWNFVMHDYQKRRVLTLLDPERDKLGAGWNIIQSKTAIGSGGWEGKGWLHGTQSQLNFLPESHTDFIIAVLAEEFGLLGVLTLLTIYMAIIVRGLYIGVTAQTMFGRLVAGSITLTFFVYVFVNMGMVSGLLPVVGVPLPLVSQGGTAIVSLLAGFGILMAISTEKRLIGQ